ncbi:substrate-binding domain-containing protein [Cellulomonas palmilytica]|uniref:substrate-binding domain-containing protein n=1 Tax=Cellulomonas palmilytica TaxID=2608402 RepID=UPI001F328474|nr:substrate-binding domain-containing protein [Cellulomonas palmilytica]UJP38583.1 substrate-binding domain-containing protein [Cellulomonas palmilytica]
MPRTSLHARVALALTAGVLASALAACSSSASADPSTLSIVAGSGTGGLVKVGFSQQPGDDAGWRAASTESVRSSLSAANGVELLVADTQQDQAGQIAALRDFVEQGVDVIAFSPGAETGWDEVLQEIKDADIPLVLVDGTIETLVIDPYITWIGHDFEGEGATVGEWVVAHHPDVAAFQVGGTPGSSVQRDRDAGFASAVGARNIVGRATGHGTRDGGRTATAAALRAHPELGLVFAHDDEMALGAVEAVEAADKVPGEDVVVVAVAGGRESLQAVVDGTIGYVVECNPAFGDQVLDAVMKAHKGEDLPRRFIVMDRAFDSTVTQADVASRPY